MRRFLASNPGLSDRFTYTVNFAGYDHDELVRIVEKMADEQRYALTTDASAALAERYKSALVGALGNARHARRVLDAMIENHALRVSMRADASIDDLLHLDVVDVPNPLPPVG
jgi:Holliday junction resolvasome RuvABC ATP-dependent DNA helicase subunit